MSQPAHEPLRKTSRAVAKIRDLARTIDIVISSTTWMGVRDRDDITVLAQGAILASGSPAAIAAMSVSAKPISAAPRTKTSWRRPSMLSCRDVHVHIGKPAHLQGVNLEVKPGESAALLGRNGVGKTTTLRAIMGLVSRRAGRSSSTSSISRATTARDSREGDRLRSQGRGIFPNLSVLENLISASRQARPQREDYVFTCSQG